MQNSPLRTYYLSDTYGNAEDPPNPLTQPDSDVLISTDFGGRPTDRIHREFDIFGQEALADHILRLVVSQHDELMKRADLSDEEREAAVKGGTGIFINSAPRVARNNAQPFYVATARGGNIRVVSTPLSGLSAIKSDIETLQYLDNPSDPKGFNGLYTGREQFRSRLTPRLLNPNHRLELQDEDISKIPDPRADWHVAYVDRFGNVITRVENAEGQWEEIVRIASQAGESRDRVRLLLGHNSHSHPTQPLEIAQSLGEATPGVASIYRNGGGIDVVVKWVPDQTAHERMASSGWRSLGEPKIGDAIKLVQEQL